MTITTAHDALEILKAGNRRFVRGEGQASGVRPELADGQSPFAVVIGCSDSRVPVEMVFDQGLGELFVVRIAGNVIAPSQIGSVEFAAEKFGTRLVVVLGHSGCGAIEATIESIREGAETASENLGFIIRSITPAIEDIVTTAVEVDDGVMRHAVRANVRASAHQLREGSEVIDRLVAEDGLTIVGAEYQLETGEVEFFCRLPEAI